LEVDPKTIDINIHPTKTEVKFDDEHTLYAILRSAVKHSLGQFNIAPVLDFERDNALDTPYSFKDKQVLTPQIEVDRSFNPFKVESTASGGVRFKNESNAAWESLYIGLQSERSRDIEVTVEDDSIMSSMFDEKENEQAQKTFQLHNKYIFNTIKSGILVIDQNRAHERILYEEYLQRITVQSGMSQQLLFPINLELSTLEIGLLNGIKPQLEQTGFTFLAFTDEHVEINAVPVGIKEELIGELFEKLISDVQNEVPDNNLSQSDLLAKSLATSLAIKNGQKLSQKEQEHIVNSLFACKEPSVTPDNRPTFITLSVEDLDKKFV
jgi:DNA mismatch repair protein MutL